MFILVFGDNPGPNIASRLQSLVFSRSNHPLVSEFLISVSHKLRRAINRLPSVKRKSLPPFSNLQEFANNYMASEVKNPVIDTVFLVIIQLAEYIKFQETNDYSYTGSHERRVVSVSYGLIAGITAAILPRGAAGVKLAAHAVQITLRLAIYMKHMANTFSCDEIDTGLEGWSFNATGLKLEEAETLLQNYINYQAIPEAKKPYISAIWPSFVTISGPPRTLTQFKAHLNSLQIACHTSKHSFGPHHASHLHQSMKCENLIDFESFSCYDLVLPKTSKTVLSIRNGRPYHANSIQELYCLATKDILASCQDFVSLFVETHQDNLASAGPNCRVVVPFGPLNNDDPMVSTIRDHLVESFTESPIQKLHLLENPVNSNVREKDYIAIVGMSGRFPGAETLDEFWELIQQGLDMHREVPSDRFDARTHCDASGKGHNKSHTPFGCFIDRPGLFDPRFFNMSPREAMQTDPMQRLALMTAYEALEMSGFVPDRTPSTHLDRVGTFYGQTSDDWREINAAQEIDTYFITGGVRAFGPGRINYHFGFSGPSFSVDTACSSSTAAIHAACNALWLHDCDTAVTGGVNVLTNPDIFSGLSKGQFLSKTGPCQTFDNDADGYCRGDAVATVILKRLADAVADHDNVLGIIRSVATNHSADAISITHPHAGTQEILYRRVLSQAGPESRDISYVEMHGTGTQAGDNIEMQSVSSVFAPPNYRSREEKLYIGSIKANVGHGGASSGITALIKTLLMMRYNSIPPHVGVKKELNRGFPDLGERNMHIAQNSISWERASSQSRNLVVNNFSAAGGNTAMVVTDGDKKTPTGVDPRSTHVIEVSARSLFSLKTNLQNMINFLDENPNVSLSNLSYTTTARRMLHNYRVSMAASNIDKLKKNLKRTLNMDIPPVPQAPKVVFTFTGQGTMYPRVGSNLFKGCSVYRDSLIEFDSICISCGFPSIRDLVDGSEARPVMELSPVLLQVAQLSIQMALTQMWKSLGVLPDVVFGHSLGEYAAFFASGILSAADAIYLVGSRARLMEENCTIGTHAMLAVQEATLSTKSINTHAADVACINSEKEFVLSALSTDIEILRSQFEDLGFVATQLRVPFAFHSSQVDAILAPFRDICSNVTFREPKCEVISSVLGKPLGNCPVDATYVCRHARQTVNFHGALRESLSSGTISRDSAFLEIGPSPVCNGFVRSTLGSSATTCASLHRKKGPWDVLASTASELSHKGIKIDWSEYHREFEDSLELLELPSYGWALSNYWIDYRGDWCLKKGTEPTTSSESLPDQINLSTTSVHRVVKESFGNTENFVLAETDLSHPSIRTVLEGHMVNNVALCPSSLYGDIGYTLGIYMYKRMNPLSSDAPLPGMNVRNMSVDKTLISGNTAPHIININAKATSSKDCIEIKIISKAGEHASFVVEFCNDSEWTDEWKRIGFLIESRMDYLCQKGRDDGVHSLNQEVAYKLFSSFVNYQKPFQGMKKVFLDPLHSEATAEVVLEAPSTDQSFAFCPYWIDSIGHLSGFILNVQLNDHDPKHVFVSHGWDSLRIAKTLVPGKLYRTYVRMIEGSGGNLVSGDVYCLEDSSVIAVFGGVTFMRIPRAVLDQVLPRPSRSTTSRPDRIPELPGLKQNESRPSALPANSNSQQDSIGISLLTQVLTIIAEECGVDNNELADPISFADLGVDSLMQLAISSRIREELDLEISSSLFIEHPTVGSLKSHIQSITQCGNSEIITESVSTTMTSQGNGNHSSVLSVSDDTTLSTEDTEDWGSVNLSSQERKHDIQVSLDQPPSTLPQLIPERRATSFLLQGNPKVATKKLFLFPDGSGSATSYTQIPDLSSDIVVYGLNSPFMTTPEEYNCGVSGIARYFIQEMKRRQAKGPYNIGGWSAGGVIAYEGAQQLIREGETVDRLILIDAPCPLTIEPLPSTLHQWFNSIGLLGDGDAKKTPPWLLPHFQASVTALSTYDFRALDSKKAPSTYIIWCEDGVCKSADDPRPVPYPYGHAQFLLENKEDFGPQLWDALVGLQNIKIFRTPGNHFTMMRSPLASDVGNAMRKAFY